MTPPPPEGDGREATADAPDLIRTSIHDEYDLVCFWHIVFVYLAGANEF